MLIALIGFAAVAALAGHGLERLDEERLRDMRKVKLAELGWA